jgi:DNA-binding MarR family transcriptional regulator/energy-coupling factor transporter ATP-binding protein EcfA2
MHARDNRRDLASDGLPGPEAGGVAGISLAAPQSIQDLGLPPLFLGQLALKHCFYMDVFTLGDLAERLKVSASIISQVLDYLKRAKWIEVRGPDPINPVVSAMGLANRHSLSDGGRRQAAQFLEYDAYAGPAPVVLKDYWRQVTTQSIGAAGVTPDHIHRALKGLVLSAEVLEQVGVAAVSGKPLFLYGPAGNGKTVISQCLGGIWQDEILVPYAIFVDGQVIQVFDEITHARSAADPGGERVDRRWVRSRRPLVTVGGELTLDMLDLAYKPTLKYFEAPLQLKANNGVFIVDDFGRQRLDPQELLNRWIIPLENHQDFLRLRTGQKFAIPFDQFMVFATNLEPRTLMDDAFLRRLRSKVKVDYVNRSQFVEIFRLCCEQYHLEFEPEAVEYLLGRYYDDGQRPLTACHPRDLLEQVLDYCRFHQLAPRLTPENLDRACHSYFVA